MAALPDHPMYGIDPSTQQPAMMPVDPNSPPPDPNLDVHGGDPSEMAEPPEPQGEYEAPQGVDPDQVEVELVEEIEVDTLNTMRCVLKAIEAGGGADNPDYAAKYAQAFQSLAIGFQALANSETDDASQAPSPATGLPPVGN